MFSIIQNYIDYGLETHYELGMEGQTIRSEKQGSYRASDHKALSESRKNDKHNVKMVTEDYRGNFSISQSKQASLF